MDGDELWTLEQLSDRVAEALSVEYDGQSNGRVREVPNARAIRWYTTIGLVDRPAGMRGRTALYGRRHLLQLVAVKRLQASGNSLAEVQQALLGSTETTLERIARLPDRPTERFWAAEPARPARRSFYGVRLGDAVTVTFDREPTAAEIATIEAAAAPLLDVLARISRTERDTP